MGPRLSAAASACTALRPRGNLTWKTTAARPVSSFMGFMETFNAAFRMRSDLDTLTYTAAESKALLMNRRVARLPYKGAEVLRCGRMLARDFQGRLVRQRGAVQNAHDVVLAVQPACPTRHVQRCEPTADMSCMCVRARGSCTGRTCAHANKDTWERRATRACWLTCAYAHGARTHYVRPPHAELLAWHTHR